MASFAGRAAKPHAWTAAIAALTIAFGAGQWIGPVLSGALADGANGLRSGLWLSVGILAVATIVAALQREPAPGYEIHAKSTAAALAAPGHDV